jgi:hypothetical protein
MAKRSMFVGMDVHKESIDISLAEEARDGEVRHYGAIAGDLEAVAKVVRALRAPNRRLRFVYEAGPCGFAHRSAMVRPSSRRRVSVARGRRRHPIIQLMLGHASMFVRGAGMPPWRLPKLCKLRHGYLRGQSSRGR